MQSLSIVLLQVAVDPLADYSLRSMGIAGVLFGLLVYGVRVVVKTLVKDRDAARAETSQWREAYEILRDDKTAQADRDAIMLRILEELDKASRRRTR